MVSGFGHYDKRTGVFIWKDSVLPPGPGRARKAGLDPRVRLYTLREVSVVLRHSPVWLAREIRFGRIKARKLGGQWFISAFELLRQMGEMPNAEARLKCGVGSGGSGSRLTKRQAKPRPARSTLGNEVAKGNFTVLAATKGRLTSNLGQSAAPMTTPGITGE